MENRHLSPDEIGQYLAHVLEPAALLAMEDHLAVCSECRKARDEAAGWPQVFLPLLADDSVIHLTEDEMAAFAAGRRGEFAPHLEACRECREAVDAMREASAPARSQSRWLPWMAVAATVALAVAVGGLWQARNPRPATPVTVASLNDGGTRIELDASGGLRGLNGFPADQQEWVREALRRGEIARGSGPAAAAPESLRAIGSSGGAFALLAPLNERVLSDRPVFEWQADPGASGYEVVVTNQALDPLARSGRISDTRWQPPSALPRGVALLWQVRSYRGSSFVTAPAPPDPPARCEIVDQQTAAQIASLRGAEHPSHLLLAIVCARAGLLAEEARELDALRAENPGSPLVERLALQPHPHNQ